MKKIANKLEGSVYQRFIELKNFIKQSKNIEKDTELSKELGIKYDTLRNLNAQKQAISIDIIYDISQKLKIKPTYFLESGEIEYFLLENNKTVMLSSPTGKVGKNGNFGQVALSIMDNAFAGDLIHPEKDIAEYMAQQAVGLYANTTTIGFYVCGESMMPVLVPNDIVLCQRVFDIVSYDFKDREAMYVIVCDEGIKVKRLQPNKERTHYKIISINHTAYPPYDKDASDIYEIWRVEWIVKKA